MDFNEMLKYGIGAIGGLTGGLIGAYVNSIFQWFGYKKQKRTEFKINSGENIHQQISAIILKLNELFPYFAKVSGSENANKAYWVQKFILPAGVEINSMLSRLAATTNFSSTLIGLDMRKISDLTNDFSNVIVELEENYARDDKYCEGKQAMILYFNDELSKFDIALRHEVFAEIYDKTTLKKQNKAVIEYLTMGSDE